MKIEEILSMWVEDCDIDPNKLVSESVNSVKYHSKYYKIYVFEKLKLAQLEQERNSLIHLKTEYYQGELDLQTLKDHDWVPFQKKILKTDLERYLNADKDIIQFNLKFALQREKVQALKDIIASIAQRSFHIKNINDTNNFKAGVY